MAYLGNSFNTQPITPATDFFSGNGVTTTFTLTRPVQSNYSIEAVVNNVQQNPSSTYSINALNQIVFVAPPSAGVNNIYVVYNSTTAQNNGVGQGTVGTQQLGSVSNINSIGSNLTLQTNGITAVTLTQTSQLLLSGWLGTNGVTPQRQFHNLGEASFTPASNNSNIAFFNAHNATGNSGTNMTMVFRGLSSNGSVESPLAGFNVNATTSTFNGYVLKPNHPSFRSTSSTYNGSTGVFSAWATSNSTAPIVTPYRNIGNNFNTTTGVFTAPVAGTYMIVAHYENSTGVVERNIGWLYYNGSNIGEWVESYGQYDNTTGVLMLAMQTGDNIQFATHPAISYGSISASIDLIH